MNENRPHILVPDEWEPFGDQITQSPFVLAELVWKEVGEWAEDARRWKVKGAAHREPGPYSGDGTDPQPAEIEFRSNRARETTIRDRNELRHLFRDKIIERLKVFDKRKDLPEKIEIKVPPEHLPLA